MGGGAAAADAGISADTVDGEIVGVGTLSVGGELAGFAAGGGGDDGAGSQFDEAEQTAAIEGEPLDVVAANQGADAGVLSIGEDSGAFDGDGFLHAAEGKGEVDAGGLRDVELYSETDEGTEAFFADGDFVNAGLEGGNDITAVVTGGGRAAESGLFIDYADGDAGNGVLRGVLDNSGQVGVLLRGQRCGETQE
jgi:hypothetical protein